MRDDTSDQEQDRKQADNKENVITKPRVSGKLRPKKKGSPVAQVKRAEREVLLEQLEEVCVVYHHLISKLLNLLVIKLHIC